MLAVARAVDPDWTEDDLRETLGEVDLARDAWVLRADEAVAGWAILEDRRDGRLVADGYVDPSRRGRGVGGRILELTEARAAERAATGAHRALQNGTTSTDDCTRRLYERRGYAPTRWFWTMAIDLGEAPPAVDVPAGIVVAAFRDDDLADLYVAIDDSFGHEWRFASGLDDFAEMWRGRERARPDLWFVAREGGDVAGAIVAEWKRNGDLGWIEWVGVRESWRRRGVGRALLATAFRRFHDLGERRVGLGVDAANPTGATRVYEAMGMQRTSEAVVYEKPL